MHRLLALFLMAVSAPALAVDAAYQWGVETVMEFDLYDASGDPLLTAVDDGNDVDIDPGCDGTFATATNDYAHFESGKYLLTLDATELMDEVVCVHIDVDSDDANDWEEIRSIETYGCHAGAARHSAGISNCGIAQGGASTNIQLATSASATAGFYTRRYIHLIDGPGAPQTRFITDYTTGRVATVNREWTGTTPTSATLYAVSESEVGPTAVEVAAAVWAYFCEPDNTPTLTCEEAMRLILAASVGEADSSGTTWDVSTPDGSTSRFSMESIGPDDGDRTVTVTP